MSPDRSPKTILVFQNRAGREPFAEWQDNLRDPVAQRRIAKRILQMEQGHYGDVRAVGSGVYELRFFFGPGYRVYFGEDGDTIVVLLCGGDKGSQRRDIRRALTYWKEYKSHD